MSAKENEPIQLDDEVHTPDDDELLSTAIPIDQVEQEPEPPPADPLAAIDLADEDRAAAACACVPRAIDHARHSSSPTVKNDM